jgi:nicotinate phosphoribosyltransferase
MGWHGTGGLALFTDLYELTMARAYVAEGMRGTAVFTLFVRRLPGSRNLLLACGLDAVLASLEALRFTPDDLEYLRTLDLFPETFLAWLRDYRFTGDVHAVPEGTPVFANEPILEVVAPIAEAQLVETLVMNQIHLQTVLASKAVRVVTAAQGRPVVDFGSRRMHGIDAAVQGARAFYVAGVEATSNVLAGRRYGIPVSGTMAHSYIQAHEDESSAFRAFAGLFPGAVLLADTYDTLSGVRRAIEVASGPAPLRISAVRLDSGDLAALAREARRLLDAAGLTDVRIVASSDLDEHRIAALVADKAPIDGFGVGTAMGVSRDAPALDLVYKLAEYDGEGRTKLSADKPVLPGRTQVFRREQDGRIVGDIIGRFDERLDGRPLLRQVMAGGRRTADAQAPLAAARQRAADALARLPPGILGLAPASSPYPVSVSAALETYHARVRERVEQLHRGR